MPTYEYRCSAGHEFEQVQRMSEPPLRVCPVCGAPAERLLSAGAGLLFKGSGFYITDYRSDAYRKAAEADSGGKPAADAAAAPAKEAGTGKDAGVKQDAGVKKDAGTGTDAGGGSSGKRQAE